MSRVADRVSPSVRMQNSADAVFADVPALHSGDHLTREEYERRYRAALGIRAELIEGVVYVSSPVSNRTHGNPHYLLISILGAYSLATPGTEGSDNATVRLDADNEPQPDILLRRMHNGLSASDPDDYIAGTPEWIAEIAASSAAYDSHEKMRAYRRNGVKEYVIWRTQDAAIDYFILRNGAYEQDTVDADGVVKSEVFPGLWLNVKALLDGKPDVAMQTMQAGIASPEHAAFAASLTAAP